MKFKDHFSRLASQYAEFRPRYPGALFDFLAKTSPAKTRAWDCACGSGQATLDLAERFDSVIATDASAQQIAEAPPHPRVTYAVAKAEESGLETDSLDLVTVAQSLHWFDRPQFYAEVERVLHKEGVLAVWTYGVPRLNDANLDRVMQTYYWETVGSYWPPERRYVEDGYRSLEFPFAEITGPSLSMREQWTLSQFLGYLRSWSATGRYADDRGEDPVIAVSEQFAPAWGDAQRARGVSW
ncbi:MAG TPA: class I SAM-dependent methyltransferase, partial [Steroidobacteraceae bacterium]|nr:class I SAM-dependent methyltransferase [Steroidobacteraceae bacterium]